MPKFDQTSLQRLRESRDAFAVAQRADGVAVGQMWARQRADYAALRRVATLNESTGVIEGLADALAAAVLNEESPSARDSHETLEELFGRAEPSAEMATGFIEGATEVLEAV